MKPEFKLAKKVWDKVFGQIFTVESMDYFRKKEGVKYTVKQSGEDEWTCDCKSFIFHSGVITVEDIQTGKKYRDTCKHIRFSMEQSGMKIKERW